jgi:hypothetical protein
MIIKLTGGTMMTEPKLEIPAELCQFVERAIDQAKEALACCLMRHADRRQPA